MARERDALATMGNKVWSLRFQLAMLETIAVVLIILWALGFFVASLGAIVHILLVAAIIVFAVRLIRGRPATTA